MRIECELCSELIEVGSFASSTEGIEVGCSACAGSFFVPADPAPAADAPRPEGPMTCPKCGDAQPEAPACRSCGLAADRFEAFAAAEEPPPPELEARWAACLERWDDDRIHEGFVETAAAMGAYAFAARRYREALRARPGDRRARAILDRLGRMAGATLMARAAARPGEGEGKEPYKNVLILLIVLVALAGVGAVYTMVKSATADQKVPATGLERR